MKRLSISLFAILAIVFAVGSAFSTRDTNPEWKKQTSSGVFVTISSSDLPANFPNTADEDVQEFLATHCPPTSPTICIQRFVDNNPQTGSGNVFLNGYYQ